MILMRDGELYSLVMSGLPLRIVTTVTAVRSLPHVLSSFSSECYLFFSNLYLNHEIVYLHGIPGDISLPVYGA